MLVIMLTKMFKVLLYLHPLTVMVMDMVSTQTILNVL